MQEDFKRKTNRCPVCGRIIPAQKGECVYCLRDIENPPKIIRVVREDEPEKRKWVRWVIGAVMGLLLAWVLRAFLHFVDDLLKGRT